MKISKILLIFLTLLSLKANGLLSGCSVNQNNIYHGFLSGYSFTEDKDNLPQLHKYWISMTVVNPKTSKMERLNLWSDIKPDLHIITNDYDWAFAEYITSSQQGELLNIKYTVKMGVWETWAKPDPPIREKK